jgi:hypothetical protein
MSIKEQPTVKHLRDQTTGFGALLRINKLLRCIGLGSKRIADLEPQFQQMRQQLREYTEYPERFNEMFSADGWLAHDSLNFDVLKQAVDTYTAHGKSHALEILLDYYGAEQVAQRVFFFNHVEELRVRRRFIDFALTEHLAGRHYSAVPLLLMMMDGAVNDAIGKGFHASDLSLDVWDSLMVADGAIYRIKEIFQKGRKKTRDEVIDMPYRNGILHGMDLGYDNPVVTAKCWCFLFVVRDWIFSKKSESARQKAFEEETRVPAFGELAEQLAATNRLRQAIEAWEARSISPAYLASLSDSGVSEEGVPEAVVLECLALWRRRNYGGMAQLFWRKMAETSKTHVREIREQFEHVDIGSYSLERLVDEAPAIAEVDVEIRGCKADSQASRWTFRLIREDEDGNPVPVNLAGGRWQIIWIHRKRDEQP